MSILAHIIVSLSGVGGPVELLDDLRCRFSNSPEGQRAARLLNTGHVAWMERELGVAVWYLLSKPNFSPYTISNSNNSEGCNHGCGYIIITV